MNSRTCTPASAAGRSHAVLCGSSGTGLRSEQGYLLRAAASFQQLYIRYEWFSKGWLCSMLSSFPFEISGVTPDELQSWRTALHQKELMRFICLTIKGHIQQRFSRSADNKALTTFYELAWNNSHKKLWNINCSLAYAWLLYFRPWLQLLSCEQLRIQTSSVTQLRLGSGGDSVQDLHKLASGIIWAW